MWAQRQCGPLSRSLLCTRDRPKAEAWSRWMFWERRSEQPKALDLQR